MTQFLAEWALRSSILIVCGALLMRALRVKDPSLRLAAWTAILCGSLAIPALTAVLPKLPIAVMRVAPSRVEAPLESPPMVPEPTFEPGRALSRPDARVVRPAAVVSKPFNWARAAVMVYVLVAVALLLRLGFGLTISLRLLRRSRVTGQATEGIQIRESDRVTAPVALGIVRPAIVLPDDWRQWDSAKMKAVLAHERSHIRRHDPAVQLLSAIHRVLLWPTPLSWFLHRQIVRVAEEVCDDAAVAVTRDRTLYAEVLLDFMRRGVWRPSWQGVPISRYGLADMRIHRILDGTALSRGVTRWGLAAILALGLPLAYLAATAHPQSAPQAQVTPVQSRQWTPFEADMVDRQYLAGSKDPVSIENYVYARRDDGSWVKFEQILPNGKQVDQRIVEDYTTRTHTSIDPSTKTLIKYPYSAKDVDYLSTPPAACGNSNLPHVEIQGYDTVEVRFTVPGDGKGLPVTEWRAPRLNCFALKHEKVWGNSTLIREALDVKEGAPAASLFEIPSTYTELPSEGMAEREREKAPTESVQPLNPVVVGGAPAQAASAGSPPVEKEITPRIFTAIPAVTQVGVVYPSAARKAGIQGNVRMRVTINKDGSVMDIQVLSGHPVLVKAALEAVQRWRYSPNQVVRVTVVTVNFSLDKAGAAAPAQHASTEAPPLPKTAPQPITPSEGGVGGGVYSVGNGVSAPTPIYKPDPQFTEEAKRAKLEGKVSLSIVVGIDGTVTDVKVIEGLDKGLTESAVQAVNAWKFKPAMKDGQPVPCKVLVEISFRLPHS